MAAVPNLRQPPSGTADALAGADLMTAPARRGPRASVPTRFFIESLNPDEPGFNISQLISVWAKQQGETIAVATARAYVAPAADAAPDSKD